MNNLQQNEYVRHILEQDSPEFPDNELRLFIDQYFSKGREYLNNLTNDQIPCYLLDTRMLRQKAEQFMSAFRACLPEVCFYYAVKSNNHPEISRILISQGIGLDISSGQELKMAIELDSKDILFSGPGKTNKELQQAVEHSNRVTVLVDSFGELSRLDEISRSLKKKVRIGVRLTTNPEGLWRKFGILPRHLHFFYEIARRCPYLQFHGIQFHTSWNLSPHAQIDFIKKLGQEITNMSSSALEEIRFVDIGGGYWPPQGEWLQAAGTLTGRLKKDIGLTTDETYERYRLPAQSIESFASKLSSAINEYLHPLTPCRICLEPGRWLSHDVMHLLISVIDKKDQGLVITDAGTNAVGWERFETDYFPILNLTRPLMEEIKCDILGALCTPHDVWGYTFWGEQIEVGDILMIPTQGAYTYSLRQNFIKPLPEVIVLNDKQLGITAQNITIENSEGEEKQSGYQY